MYICSHISYEVEAEDMGDNQLEVMGNFWLLTQRYSPLLKDFSNVLVSNARDQISFYLWRCW